MECTPMEKSIEKAIHFLKGWINPCKKKIQPKAK
jgi:hypothetical protein